MPLFFQLVLFAVPGVLIYLGIHFWTPVFLKKGRSLLSTFFFFLWLPVIPLLPLALILFLLFEGGECSLQVILERFRLLPIQKSDWLVIALALVATLFLDQLLEPVGKKLARVRWLSPPSYLPAPFNPLKKFKIPPREFMGSPLRGNWKLLLFFIPLHIVAMFSEEIMWRGFILPLQEGVFGEIAWLVNGLMWAWLVHAGLKWHFIGMLPGMLIAPWVAQYTGNTFAAFIVHAGGNSILWILLVLGALGIGEKKEEKSVE